MGSPLLLGVGTFAPPGPVYDPDAQAFFTAESTAGVTLTTTQKTAVNNLVVNLKAANIWTKFKAIYPIVGGTATAHKFNLKNPADTNAAFRLAFSGGWTHSATGMLSNGTNAYADTFIVASTQLSINNTHLSYYSRTNNNLGGTDMGAWALTSQAQYVALQLRAGDKFHSQIYLPQSTVANASVTNTDSTGFFLGSRTASNVLSGFKNGIKVITNSNSPQDPIPYSVYIGSVNNRGLGAFNYVNKECSFASLGSGLTDLEAQVFNQIVEGYQFELSRNINPSQSFYYNTAYSNETNAFLYSTQITDATTQGAVNTLVSDLKGYGIWTKMSAIYPMVGGTATTNKFNLVNSQDTNAAFRLSFVGGWTHSSLGALPNGTNAYADTFLTPTTNLTNNNTHLSIYSRTETNGTYFDMGSGQATGQYFDLALRLTGSIYTDQYNNSTGRITTANSTSTGHYISTRTASNIFKLFKNNAQLGTTQTGASTGFTSLTSSIYIGALHEGANTLYYSNRQYSFASIGTGLTDTEAANFYTAVQNFQTTLGRAIFLAPPTVSDPDAQAFINAATIVDQAESTAVNNLCIGLKADSIWTKMKAVYPMIGSSASSQKFNLINPLDTNAAFRLTFNGGWTHSFNGALPNGTNAYANTNLTPSSSLTTNNTHLSIYMGTDTAAGNKVEMGVGVGGTLVPIMILMSKYTGTISQSNAYNLSTNQLTASNTNASGFYIGSRTSSTSHKLYKSSSVLATDINTNTNTLPTLAMTIGALNSNGSIVQLSDRRFQFASIGDGLTDTDATNLYNRVQAFNTSLARQV